jgi:HSP20 family protein
MALVRWNSWREMATLQQQMNRLFDEALVPATGRERSFVRVPAAEMEETQEAIHLKLEVPGIEAKYLHITF